MEEIDEEQTPEGYFQTLSNTVLQQQPTWRIRRQAGLMLLNFTKQVMYKDLDPKNWPQGAGLEDHPIVSHLFGSGELDEQDGGLEYSEEYEIDSLEGIHEQFPIIYDADSSQHSALIDAVNGQNLVIEGPPGTGKSQTITNLIAASIANGKKVLFVAEKMAALNVVKARLDAAGLGDFCLELHSHKTNKQKFLESLGERLNRQSKYRKPKAIQADIALFESQRQKLSDYAELINSPWQETGRSIHDILSATTRLRHELNIDPDKFLIDEVNGQSTTELRRRELLETTKMLQSIFEQTAAQAKNDEIKNHHWYGVGNTELLGHQTQNLIEYLDLWNQSLEAYLANASTANQEFALQIEEQFPLQDLQFFATEASRLPDLLGGEPLSQINYVVENYLKLSKLLDQYQTIHSVFDQYSETTRDDFYTDPDRLAQLNQALAKAGQAGVQRERTISDLAFLYQGLEKFTDRAKRVEGNLKTLRERLPTNLGVILECTPAGLLEISNFVSLCEMLPIHLWKHRDAVFDDPDLDGLLAQLTTRLKPLVGLHASLDKTFDLSAPLSSKELQDDHSVISQGGVFKWLSSKWRQSRKRVLSCALPSQRNSKALSLLPELIGYVEGIEGLQALNNKNTSLADHFRGVETPIDDLNQLRRWYKAIRGAYGRGFSDRASIADAAFRIDRELALNLIDFYRTDLADDVSKLLSKLSTYRSALSGVSQVTSNTEGITSTAAILFETIGSVLSPLNSVFSDKQISLDFAYRFASDIERQRQAIEEWHQEYDSSTASTFELSIFPGRYSMTSLSIYRNTLTISEVISKCQSLRNGLFHKPDPERYEALRALGIEFATLHEAQQPCLTPIENWGMLVKNYGWSPRREN